MIWKRLKTLWWLSGQIEREDRKTFKDLFLKKEIQFVDIDDKDILEEKIEVK